MFGWVRFKEDFGLVNLRVQLSAFGLRLPECLTLPGSAEIAQ